MKKLIIILVLLFIICTACTGSQQSILYLNERSVSVERGHIHDLYIGLRNQQDTAQTYHITFYCKLKNCENAVQLQSFPVFELQAQTTGAFPVRIIASPDAAISTYPVVIEVSKPDSSLVGKQEIRVFVTDELGAKKAELRKVFDAVLP